MANRERLPSTEAELVDRLARALPRLTDGLSLTDIRREERVGEHRADLTAVVRAGSVKRTLVVEAKRLGEPRLARDAIFQLLEMTKGTPGTYPVFAAPYLTKSTRELCREAGVGYLDLVGNVFLRFDNVLVERTTPFAIRQERKALRSLSAPKMSQTIRTLLSRPERAFRITELASVSGVSPALAYKAANLLELKGLARRDEDRRVILVKPGDLLDAWADSLDFDRNRIVPTYSLKRTPEAIMKAVAQVARKTKRAYAFTMFAGASLVAPAVRFHDVTCYVGGDLEDWIKDLGLKEVDSGSNLQLVVPRDRGVLLDYQRIKGYLVASNLQLYADLLKNPARGREQAEAIRERIGF